MEQSMTGAPRERQRWCLVVVFAVGMAWVESASVFYLRVMVDRIQPYQENPLPIRGVLGPVEIVREAATLVMLLAVGMLAGAPAGQPPAGTGAGRTWHKRLGYTAIAFGVWDILYYVFLRLISDWPRSLFDWDILFLLPLPWWGPVLAPVCIASLMIVWGTIATQFGGEPATPLSSRARATLWSLGSVGVALALYVFMADSLRVIRQGLDATRQVLPQPFNWPMFCVALTLMTAPVAQSARSCRRPPSAPTESV
jgi:hypothetical protein